MKKQLSKTVFGSVMALMLFAQPSQALENDLTLYLWGAGISGNATLGSQDIPSDALRRCW
jgi:hypothetical protein